MPQQEVFFEQKVGGYRIEVLKTYDTNYAREAFGSLDEAAQSHLWHSLKIEDNFDSTDIPASHDLDREEFLWEATYEAAREDGRLFSFFVVNETTGNRSSCLYVSPDWPSAEKFAAQRVCAIEMRER